MAAPRRLATRIMPILATLGAAAVLAAPQSDSEDSAAVQRLLLEAQRREQEGDLDGALQDYLLIADRFPQDPGAAQALLSLARGRHRMGDAAGSESAARRLTESFPDSPHAAGGFFQLAELEAASATNSAALEESRAILRNVWVLFGRQRYPALVWRSAAQVKSGELALRLGALDEAAGLFVAAIEDEPTSAWTGRAYLGFAAVALAGREWLAASQVLQEMVDRSRDSLPVSPSELRQARNGLTLIHRLEIRPAAGEKQWQTARRLPLSFKRPIGVAADPAGSLTVTDEGERQVIVVGAAGDVTMRRSYDKVHRPAWGLQGEPLVAVDDGLARPESGQRLTFTVPRKQRQQPLEGVLAGEQGALQEWYLLTDKPAQVLHFDPGAGYRSWLTDPDQVQAVDLARDRLHRLYVLDRRGKRVLRYSAQGVPDVTVAASAGWKRPEALTVDAIGNVYVLDRGSRRIEIFDSTGNRIATLGPTLPGGMELETPRDIAVDGAGRLIVADSKLGAILVLE